MEILEPSAGIGSIAEAIVMSDDTDSSNDLTCIEVVPQLCHILELKGFNVIHGDFLEASGEVDRIIMNPPFENGQDVAHVQHAFDMLKEGGRLVAIMAASALDHRHRNGIKFLEWANEQNIDLDECRTLEDQFNGSDAFRTTGVRVVVVVITKNDQPWTTQNQKGGA